MTRIQGTCPCAVEGCSKHLKEASRKTWVDQLTGICRPCEIGHGKRWGHHNPNLPAAEGKQIQTDTSPPGL